MDFINQTDLDEMQDKASIIDAFFQFAQKEQKKEAETLINEEQLNVEAAKAEWFNAAITWVGNEEEQEQ